MEGARTVDSMDDWWKSLIDAIAVGQQIAVTRDQFNTACDHIVRLLVDASILLGANSHASATFLAITAFEETAKVHLGMFRRAPAPLPRSKDPLYRHCEKHRLAAGPTVAMGRLKETIGESRLAELMELARTGGLVGLRESCLYLEQSGSVLKSPIETVTRPLAREILLLAIEAFDDAVVGCTDHTYELGQTADAIFERWSAADGEQQGV